MVWKDFKKGYKELEDGLDLSKRFPGYFNKWVFRIMLLVVASLFLITFQSEGNMLFNVWAVCPDNASEPCLNPYYLCSNINVSYDSYNVFFKEAEVCFPDEALNWKVEQICENNNCNKRYLQPGEVIGNPPNKNSSSFFIRVICIVGIAFAINHMIFLFRREIKKKEGAKI